MLEVEEEGWEETFWRNHTREEVHLLKKDPHGTYRRLNQRAVLKRLDVTCVGKSIYSL